ncbi:MAG: VOC family protein [Polyangiaceae bacterium]
MTKADKSSLAPMIDHISLRVKNFDQALAFYAKALRPLDYAVVMQFPGAAGLGARGKPDFWITATDQPVNPTHVAFAADRATVRAFHKAALKAGARDNGAPGLRAEYHPNYYGAFVLDADGNNIEAVCHLPEGEAPAPAKKAAAKKAPAKKAAAKKAPAKKAPAKKAKKR